VSEETLFTAARRLVRNLNVDFPSGLISQETEAAAHTLQIMIEREQREVLRAVENRLAENAPRI
jgi:hypothetical protein